MSDNNPYAMTPKELHVALDILMAGFFHDTHKLFSESTIMELAEWSHKRSQMLSERVQDQVERLTGQ